MLHDDAEFIVAEPMHLARPSAVGSHNPVVLSRRWFWLCVVALIVAGCFIIFPLLARVPAFADSTHQLDPAQKAAQADDARRMLAIHVTFAFHVWFYAFAVAMSHMLLGRRPAGFAARHAHWLAWIGALMVVASYLMPDAPPVMANYVPVVDSWVFLLGLAAFAVAVMVSWGDRRMLPVVVPEPGQRATPDFPALRWALRCSALAFFVAMATIIIAWQRIPQGLSGKDFFEPLFWGGGHVLQWANVSAMCAGWMLLIASMCGSEPLNAAWARVIFPLLVLPTLAAPFLAAGDVMGATYHVGATQLMQWGIFPMTVIVLIACLARLVIEHQRGKLTIRSLYRVEFTGFATSAILTLTGFVIGAMVRGQTTIITAHYHAAIGGVTVSFMAAAMLLFQYYGYHVRSPLLRRLAPLQPVAFGLGQFTLALGLYIAGSEGTERKVYGAEQVVRTATQEFGLIVMGVGGVFAILGGILFVVLVVHAWRGATHKA